MSPRARAVAYPLLIAAVALALWRTPVVLPLKVFVVLLHEVSHGLAAVATGGAIERMEISANEGGLCVTRGGWRAVVLSAGYLGSLLWGALLLLAASRSTFDRAILGLLGIATALVTVAYVRTLFGFAYGLAAAVAMVAVAWKLSAAASDLVLRTVGTVSCLYVVEDIVSDLVVRSVPGSDAHALGEITGIPGRAWGVLWVLAAVVVVLGALAAAARSAPDARPAAASSPRAA